jgi:hypothetical protein
MSNERPKPADWKESRWEITPERLARCTPEALKEAGREIAKERKEGRILEGWYASSKAP